VNLAPFHKELEDFFNAMPLDHNLTKIYYERRSKQYAHNLTVLPQQKVNFKILTQSFISVFLRKPHNGHRHESKLLADYQNQIFIEKQSKYPYYTSALLFIKIEGFYRNAFIQKELKPYKSQIAFLVKEIAAPNAPNMNNEKEIAKYCDGLLSIIWDDNQLKSKVGEAIEVFNDVREKWIKEKGGKYRFGIKDSEEFTTELKKRLWSDISINNNDSCNRGTIIKVGRDKNNYLYGFISKKPQNVFFHEKDGHKINIEDSLGREVLYDIQVSATLGDERAINVNAI